jgi:hypothetical protein
VRVLAAATVAVALGFTAIAAADQPSGAVTSYATAGAPAAIAAGPNGNPWFLEPSVFKVGTVAAGGLTEFSTTHFGLTAITAAPAGTLWVLGESGDFGGLWQLTTTGTLTPKTGLFHAPTAFATDSAGDVWIAYHFLNAIHEVTPPSYSQETDPDSRLLSSGATSIAAGPDGTTMWFVEQPADKIGSIGQTGTVTEYALPAGVSGTPGNIVLGSDGNLWVGVVGTSASWLVRVTGSGSGEGATTAFALPSGSHANVDVLASGPDGRLWMADATTGGGDLTAMTTAGAFTDYPQVLTSGSSITSIVADPGGADALWMTNATATTVQRVPLAPPPPATPPPVPVLVPPVLASALGAPTGIAVTAATVSGTISEPAGSVSTSATYQFEYGTDTTYGTSTTAATAMVTPAGTVVSANLTGLNPYTTYHYRLLASDCAQASCQAASPDETFTTGSTLAPSQGTSTGAKPVSGTILIHVPHHHGFVRLRSGELVPLGATINARHGKVLIVSSTGPGQQASGVFSGGLFEVTQPAGKPETVLVLQSSFKACQAATRRAAPLARTAKSSRHKRRKHKASKKTVNQVFGNAHGQFATQGQYATAADQGTSWQEADRCDGTLVAVTVGKVSVTDRQHHRTFVVTAGHHVIVHHR